jgi:hypothetical protein
MRQTSNGLQCANCLAKFVPGLVPNDRNCADLKKGGGNNVYFRQGCPALMEDGRFITNYRPSNELTDEMQKANGFRSSNQFRTFMQNNGNEFMDTEREYVVKHNSCAPTSSCSQGWTDLWSLYGGNWGCNYASPYSMNK